MNQSIELTMPDDWHLHLRDGAAMAGVLPHTTRQFERAIIMPGFIQKNTEVIQMSGRFSMPVGELIDGI